MAAAGWRSWVASGFVLVLALGWIAGATAGIEYGARHSWLFWLEHWTGDWRTMLLSDRPKSQHPDVAVVKVTEDTVDLFPYRTPIDRGFIARLVSTIDEAGPKAIAIDFLFVKATEPVKEDELIRAIKAAKARVVIAVGDNRAELTEAHRAYQKAFLERSGAVGGYANLLTGGDRVVRFVAPPADSEFPQSLAVAAAKPDAPPADGAAPHFLVAASGRRPATVLPGSRPSAGLSAGPAHTADCADVVAAAGRKGCLHRR